MSGRARGTARGRARGTQQQPPRRPGDAPEGAPPPPTPAAQQPITAPATAPTTGRARQRGAVQQQVPRPGGAVAPPVTEPPTGQMASLTVSGEGVGAGDRGGASSSQTGKRFQFDDIVTRPAHVTDKTGSSGRSVNLVTNHVKIISKPDWMLYQYRVDFTPSVESRGLRYRLLNTHRELMGASRVFDGTMLFIGVRLPDKETIVHSTKDDGEIIEVKITATVELPPSSPSCQQLYNMIMNKMLRLIGYKLVGRNYYDYRNPSRIEKHKLEVWPGFQTAIGLYENCVLLNVDVSHKILRIDTVLDVMLDISRNARNIKDDISKRLLGQIVLTRYNNKTYRIDDILWEQKPSDSFEYKGEQISYIDYYKKQHNVPITQLDQPLLLSRPKASQIKLGVTAFHLIPELCTLTGLTDEVRADFNVMKDIAVHTRVAPQQRFDTLQKFVNTINKTKEVVDDLNNWGLKFDDTLLNITGRQVPPEKIFQADREYQYKESEAEWSREVRDKKCLTPVNLGNWLMLFTNRDQAKAQDFINALLRVSGPMGMQIAQPNMIQLPDDRTDSYLRTIRENLNRNVQMVVCLLPTDRKDRYDAIKKLCCLDSPVPSQMIVGRTLNRKPMLMSVSTKIALQLNCKLGGELWALDIPIRNLMVIGIDVYHDSACKGQSVMGFTASLNKTLTRYYSRTHFQPPHTEICDALKTCMNAALRQYSEVNGTLPEKIIVYRDGVGDGQLAHVQTHEVPQIAESFKTAGKQYEPKLSVIVVKKRVNARFFKSNGNGGQLTNPPPGTIIDTEVTKSIWYDFFLVSQSVRQGTVSPTHYNIIHDKIGLKPDHMQRLTYKLTHLYYNWPGTIRVPAPCQYAHKLAFLVGQSIHKDPDLSLANTLYYL